MAPPATTTATATATSMYAQYKADTDAVASWLAATARDAGCPGELLPDGVGNKPQQQQQEQQQQPKPTGRLKGKARKEAKKAAAAAAETEKKAPPLDKNNKRYIIKVRNFVPLAEYIVSSGIVRAVPSRLSDTLDRVIELRTEYGHEQRGNEKNKDEREGSADAHRSHEFFVDVLRRVREVLHPLVVISREKTERAQGRDMKSEEEATPEAKASNRFEGLEVFEPSEEFLNAPAARQPPPSRKPVTDHVVFVAETQTAWEDAFFAYATLVHDLNQLRAEIRATWARTGRQIDVCAAAVATDTAMDLARGLIDEVLPLLDLHGGMPKIAHAFYVRECRAAGVAPDEHLSTLPPTYPLPIESYEVADQTFRVALHFVEAFDINYHVGSQLLDRKLLKYDLSVKRSALSNWDKFSEDMALLRDVFIDMGFLKTCSPSFPVLDQFCRSAGEKCIVDCVRLHVVFGAQIHLDLNHDLRCNTSTIFRYVYKQMSLIASHIEGHLRLCDETGLKSTSLRAVSNKRLRETLTLIRDLLKDPLNIHIKEIFRKRKVQVPGQYARPHLFMQRSPVMAGLMLHNVRALYYNTGLMAVNGWGALIHASHLLNALRQQKKLVKLPWLDLMVCESMLKYSSFFVGDAPVTPADCCDRYLLQMGMSAAMLADPTKRRPTDKFQKSRSGPRRIKDRAPVYLMFERRYVECEVHEPWTPEQLEDILSRSEYDVDEDSEVIQYQVRGPSAEPKKKKKSATGAGTRTRSPEKLLHALVLALNAESLELAFPHLLMHSVTWRILQRVKDSCDALLRTEFPLGHIDYDAWPPTVVGYILAAAAVDEKFYRAAADTINEMLSSGGGGCVLQHMEEEMIIKVQVMVRLEDMNVGISWSFGRNRW